MDFHPARLRLGEFDRVVREDRSGDDRNDRLPFSRMVLPAASKDHAAGTGL